MLLAAQYFWEYCVPGSSSRAWGRCSLNPQVDPRQPVHPHVRGADPAPILSASGITGSSPRAWGRWIRDSLCAIYCSGSSPRAWSRCWAAPRPMSRNPVHPHVRGADPWPPHLLMLKNGSSPRAWGRLPDGSVLIDTKRFIPTCVGQIRQSGFVPLTRPVHPHVRGADVPAVTAPPPVARFIPTCVGQIKTPPREASALAVHPHVRGADDTAAEMIRES